MSAGKVLVAGGTGFVGGQVVKLFERLGYDVVVISRKAAVNTAKTPSLLVDRDTERKTKTWSDIEADGLPSGTVAVINCSGQNVLDPLYRWNDSFKDLVYNSRVGTNRTLANAIINSPEKPACFIHMSGVGFYPPDQEGEEGRTEESEGGSHDWLARLVVDWEAAAQLPATVPTRVVSLRAGVVLGRHGGMVQQILPPFFLGLGGRMGAGDQVMPWIHVKDVAGLMAHCVTSQDCAGVYNTVAPEVITNNTFVKAFAGELNRPAFFPLPELVWRTIFGEERANMICQSQTVLPKKALKSGYNFSFPTIKEACEEFAHLSYVDPDDL